MSSKPAKSANTMHDTIIAINVGVARALASAIYGRPTAKGRRRGSSRFER